MNRRNTIVAGFLAASAAFFGIAYAQGPGCGSDGKPGMMRSSMQGGMMDPGARGRRVINLRKPHPPATGGQMASVSPSRSVRPNRSPGGTNVPSTKTR